MLDKAPNVPNSSPVRPTWRCGTVRIRPSGYSAGQLNRAIYEVLEMKCGLSMLLMVTSLPCLWLVTIAIKVFSIWRNINAQLHHTPVWLILLGCIVCLLICTWLTFHYDANPSPKLFAKQLSCENYRHKRQKCNLVPKTCISSLSSLLSLQVYSISKTTHKPKRKKRKKK